MKNGDGPNALFLFSAEASVLRLIEPNQCGWQDGGCYIFAVALRKWLGPAAQLGCLYRDGLLEQGTVDHWFCQLGDVLLDSDGTYQADELIEKWTRLFRGKYRVSVETPAAKSRASSVLRDDKLSAEVARLLQEEFGSLAPKQLKHVLGSGM